MSGDTEYRQCIYCLESVPTCKFNREHVIPKSFGTFENNMVLHCVCRDCNQFFANRLERYLGRGTLEGIQRFLLGLTKIEEFRPLGDDESYLAVRGRERHVSGVHFKLAPDLQAGTLSIEPARQVGFSSDLQGEYIYFSANELPTPEELESYGLRGRPLYIVSWGFETDEELCHALKEKGYSPDISSIDAAPPVAPGDSVRVEVTGEIDHVIWRAMAKIAFNYLADFSPAIARMPQFNDCRRYVRYGVQPSKHPVVIDWDPIIRNDPSEGHWLGHIVTVQWVPSRREVVGQVQLNRQFRYYVLLADGGFQIPPSCVDRGHFFDVGNRVIKPLGHTPPND